MERSLIVSSGQSCEAGESISPVDTVVSARFSQAATSTRFACVCVKQTEI